MMTTIPFSGFYESIHDSEIDNALQFIFTDRATGCEVNEALHLRALDCVDWRHVRNEYAREYAEQFAHQFAIPSLKFESLDSPRFYNFTTDRVFCTIEPDDLRRIMATFDLPAFAEYVREKFTSRDGFASYYSPELADWGSPAEYDHNQAGAVLEFYAQQESSSGEFDQWDEFALLEDARGNGLLDQIFWEAGGDEFRRLVRLQDYLEDRAERLAA